MTENIDTSKENSDSEIPGWKNLETALHQMIRMSQHEQDLQNYHTLKQYYE